MKSGTFMKALGKRMGLKRCERGADKTEFMQWLAKIVYGQYRMYNDARTGFTYAHLSSFIVPFSLRFLCISNAFQSRCGS
jgi:hypothetical protein